MDLSIYIDAKTRVPSIGRVYGYVQIAQQNE